MWVTGELARFVTDLRFEDIPSAEVQMGKKVLLDLLGCGIVGTIEKSSKILKQHFSEMGGKKECGIFGSPAKLPAANAVFLNSTTAHAHDLDDTHDKAVIHPGVLVIPPALALAERDGIDGRAFMTALVAGYEVHSRVALGSNIGPKSGWILTPTCGIFGAAATAGKLLNLNHKQMVNALGIAHCMSSGNTQTIEDGVWTKRLQVGHAASMGLLSALLAQQDFTGAQNAFDGTFAFHKIYFRDYNLAEVTKDLGKKFEITHVSFKPYPCCRFIHSSADATFRLVEKHNIHYEDVQRITVRVTNQVKVMVCEPEERKKKPETVVDAQFSIPFSVACIVVKRRLFIDEFTEASIQDPKILETASKVTCVVDEELDRVAGREIAPIILTIEVKDGSRFEQRVDAAKGHFDNPMTIEDLVKKFRDCSDRVLPRRNIDAVCSKIEHIEQMKDFKAFMALMKP